MEKKFIIQKVPLETLLDTLDELWDNGVEFVDVEVTLTNLRDRISFIVKDEYMIKMVSLSAENYEELIYLGP